LSKHLSTLAQACGATEVVLFERTTFLVVATSTEADKDVEDPHKLHGIRYERTSELIKAFKYSCVRVREEFHSLEMELSEFTAVLDELTRNTYVLIIVHNPTIGSPFPFLSVFLRHCHLIGTLIPCVCSVLLETAALKMNICLARNKFEELQTDSLFSS
jgi:Ras-related GTP-binding protein A/B